MSRAFAVAQLRHLYAMMLHGDVRDTAEAARGLLGPAIADLERAHDADDKDRARVAKLEAALREAKHGHDSDCVVQYGDGLCDCGAADHNARIDTALATDGDEETERGTK